ncbi:hypothetical protein [Desulfocurvus sp.]|uniref:hypothetical protein n=1 Tax=Desulfocurvus sp. TaxID=2871698 RepID=UPI0025B85CDA|nr:hypothetical protein [Desulfocurvus sp.]MCK9238796.1 hypothetical protein [Desulfocurvus sp.]
MRAALAARLRALLDGPGPQSRAGLAALLDELRDRVAGLRAVEDALGTRPLRELPGPLHARLLELARLREALTALWHEGREALDGPMPLRPVCGFGHSCRARPSSICFHPGRDSLLVTDFGRPELLEFSPRGAPLAAHVLGLRDPTRVLLLEDGRLALCDRGNARLLLLGADLRPLRALPFPPELEGPGRRPYDIAALPGGLAVMTKNAAHEAPRWFSCDPDAAAPAFAPLSGPQDCTPINCVGLDGLLHVTASAPNALLRHDPRSGRTEVLHAEPLGLRPTKVEPCPGGLWCASEGRLARLDAHGAVLHAARVATLTGTARCDASCLGAFVRHGQEFLVVGDMAGRRLHLLAAPEE